MTVNEYAPDSDQGNEYRTLAKKIVENTKLTIPTPLEMDELEALLVEFGILDDDTKHAEIIGKPAEAAAK
jgi:nitrogenase iron protein NifH